MKACPFCAEEIQDAATVCKHCGRDLKGGAAGAVTVQPKKQTGACAAGCAIMFAIVGFFILQNAFCGGSTSQVQTTRGPVTPPPPKTPSPREQLAQDVDISGTWSKSGFGNVAVWTIKLKNKSKVTTWQDLQYRTTYYGESGKELASRKGELTIALAPGKSRTITEHNDGFIPQGAHQAGIELIGGIYDKLPTPEPPRAAAPRPRP